jgi:hypothetical protein
VLHPGGSSVGAETHPRTERRASVVRGSHTSFEQSSEVGAQSRTSRPRGHEQDAIGADARSSRGDQATREPQPGDRKRTRSRRTPRRIEGQPARRWQTAHRDFSIIGFGRRSHSLGLVAIGRHKTSDRYGRNEPLDPSSPQGEVGVKPDVPQGSSRRRTAGGEQTAAMRNGCRRGTNLRRVERQWGPRTRSGRPQGLDERPKGKPGEPTPGTGCNMPGAVNGRSCRGGEKPRGRSETDGVAAIGRRRSSDLWE